MAKYEICYDVFADTVACKSGYAEPGISHQENFFAQQAAQALIDKSIADRRAKYPNTPDDLTSHDVAIAYASLESTVAHHEAQGNKSQAKIARQAIELMNATHQWHGKNPPSANKIFQTKETMKTYLLDGIDGDTPLLAPQDVGKMLFGNKTLTPSDLRKIYNECGQKGLAMAATQNLYAARRNFQSTL